MNKEQKPFKSFPSLFFFFFGFRLPWYWNSEGFSIQPLSFSFSLFFSFAHTKSNIFASRSRSLIIFSFSLSLILRFVIYSSVFGPLLYQYSLADDERRRWEHQDNVAQAGTTPFLLGSSIFCVSHFGIQWLWRCDIVKVKWLLQTSPSQPRSAMKMHIGPLSIRLNCMLLWDELTRPAWCWHLVITPICRCNAMHVQGWLILLQCLVLVPTHEPIRYDNPSWRRERRSWVSAVSEEAIRRRIWREMDEVMAVEVVGALDDGALQGQLQQTRPPIWWVFLLNYTCFTLLSPTRLASRPPSLIWGAVLHMHCSLFICLCLALLSYAP